MKVINLNSQNVISCECGNVFEFGYADYEVQFASASEDFFQVGVRCPICGKLHLQAPDNYDDTKSKENLLKYRSPMDECSYADLKVRIDKYYETGAVPFEIGDSKTITLKNGDKTSFVFIGQDLYYAQKTGSRAPLSFVFADCLRDDQPMNRASTNRGGWRNSYMRKWLNEEFVKLVPEELMGIIKVSKKWTMNSGETPTATDDNFYLLSEIEVFGKNSYSYDGEGVQYEFFKNWRNRVRTRAEYEYGLYWWLRSPNRDYSYYFCYVSISGGVDYSTAGNSYGVSPAFNL